MSYTSPKPLPYVPPDIEIGYVPEHDPNMAIAKVQATTRSQGCKLRLGGVIVNHGKIVGRGVNCKDTLVRPAFCVRDVLNIPSGQGYDLCPNCAGSHCEPPTIADAQAHSADTNGGTFYLYGHWWFCEPCCNALREAGIRKAYLVEGATELFGSPKWELPVWPADVRVRTTIDDGVAAETVALLQTSFGRANIEMVDPSYDGNSIILDLAVTPTAVTLNGTTHTYTEPPLLLKHLAEILPSLINGKS